MKNYIGNNNEINKKKYKKSLPPKLNPDAGNVEHNIDMFNKASSGDANLSSSAGMNGMAESYDRDSLIARIIEFGKHYNFDKYTDAQLNAMLNRLVDAENHKKRVLPKHQDKINIQSSRHTMNDDPSYNFDDPEREGEYRVENLREALNKLDHYCIDNDKRFHDLRSLYENIAHTLSSQEKTELKNLLNTTNDPDAVKAYLDSKDPDKKQDEELKEDKKGITFEELMKLADRYYMQGGSEIIEFWDKNSFDEYEKEFGPMSRETAIKLMKTMKAVTDDELEAGRYWSKDAVESYSVKSNSTTDSVDVVDDETNRVVSRHRGENALDDANHEKDVMNMNEDFDPFDTYSLQDKIYDFLYFLIDDIDYEEMISKVSDEFGMSPDEAEKYVKSYMNDSEVEWHDTADLEEDYTKADDEWGNPYTLDEVFDQLKELTNDFTDKDGTVRCWYEQEKIYGLKVLKKYYNVVEVSDGRMSNEEDMSWIIAYSDPKETRKKR